MSDILAESLGPKFDELRARYAQTPEEIEEYQRTVRAVVMVRRLLMTIDDERRRVGISKAELARRIGADPSVVRRLFSSEGSNPTLKTVVEILSALGIEVQLTAVDRPDPGARKKSRQSPSRQKVA